MGGIKDNEEISEPSNLQSGNVETFSVCNLSETLFCKLEHEWIARE
jgi:hypothetical protein